MQGFFRLENISFKFPGSPQLLLRVCLTLDENKTYALMGGNGSGKTTLLNLITGYYKPQSGSISLRGRPITGLAPYVVNRIGVGRTFQDLRLVSKLSVKENILLAMKGNPTDNWIKALLPASIYRKQVEALEARAAKIIADYSLQEVECSLASQISFGQQKLLNLACCVATGADLLLLDEPVAGISPAYRDQIKNLMSQLKREGKTILMIEHNIDFVTEAADRLLFLTEGKIHEYPNIESMRSSPIVSDVYF